MRRPGASGVPPTEGYSTPFPNMTSWTRGRRPIPGDMTSLHRGTAYFMGIAKIFREPEYAEIAKDEPRVVSAPPVMNHQRSPSSGSSSSLSPQSILRSNGLSLSTTRQKRADSSPRSRKHVSICDVAHDSNLPQEMAIRKALNVPTPPPKAINHPF